jgi:hypothetical protein
MKFLICVEQFCTFHRALGSGNTRERVYEGDFEMTEINDGTSAGANGVHGGAADSAAYEPRASGRIREEDLAKLIDYINDIRYGSVTVIIQDGRVLQIEKNEKIRLR